ncbi:hypothetical protein [Sphingomonas sp. G-3-2-10]|uniref:hypothetical protein n=1 Tax=Sphingomonas sp. G-3-2-10 TaxID=2728838 RepID=UPI00146D2219|nr:hypothetical protein [Sphingomonas sp. G-3-2-10]NML07968.1 hypothetical protein [Sphingomonas sp. G-3-2-10]
MPFKSETEKLPKGQSDPLKPSQFEAALAAAGISIDTHFVRRPSRRLFDVHFWPPNPNVSYERFYITIGAVPSEDAREVGLRVEILLPQAINWMSEIVSLDTRSPIRREQQLIALS